MTPPATPSRRSRAWPALLLTLLLTACGDDADKLIASAQDYLSKNDAKAAVIQLKSALQANPQSAQARFLLGKALLQNGEIAGAETELRRALEYKHPVDEVAPLLAQALVFMRQPKKATDEFGRTQLTQPQAQASLKTTLAAAYNMQGQTEQAREALKAALAADANYAPALLTEASYKATQGDFAGASAIVDGVLGRTPDNAQALKLRGDIRRFGSKDNAGALADYRKAIELRPTYAEAHATVLEMLIAQGQLEEAGKHLESLRKQAPGSYTTRYFSTLLAAQRKDFKLAREQAQQLIKIAPNDVRSLQLAAAIESRLNATLQAETYLNKALAGAPESLPLRRQLATVYLRMGQAEKALNTMQPALKSKDLDSATSSLLGQIYLQSGDAAKAEQYLSMAAKSDPKNARNRVALAVSHMAGGKVESGLGELEAIASSDSGTTADLALISANLRRGDYDRALKAIAALEAKMPTSPMPSNLRGRTLLAKKDIAGARKSFERALQIDPKFFDALASLAGLDVIEKKPGDARKRFEAVLAQDPKDARALVALAELRTRDNAPKAEVVDLLKRAITAAPTTAQARLMLVAIRLRDKEFKEAVTDAQAGVTAIPESAEMLDALGRAQAASGDTNQAAASFNKLAGLQPSSPLPQMRLAALYLSMKDRNAARQSLRKALDIKADHLDAQAALIAMAVEDKNYDDATKIASAIQKQRPKQDAGYALAGDIAASRKDWDGAVKAYQEGLKVAPGFTLASKMDIALRAAGKTAEAQKFSANWLAGNPKDIAFRMYTADIALRAQDFPAAEKQYLVVVQAQPTNAIAYNNLGWVQGRLKKETAIGNAQKAIELAPQQPAFMDTLATLYLEKNEVPKALELQKQAVALQPENPLFKVNLARIQIKAGQKDEARKELEAVAKLGDKYRGQAEVATLLKSL